jgi:hypothetical protein
MKRKLLTLLLLLISLTGFTQKNSSSIVSVSQSRNSITVSFNLPEYSISDTSVLKPYGISEAFKYIDIEQLGIIDDVGYPQLPQLTVDLSIPQGASNFRVTASNTVAQTVLINRKIYPAQEDLKFNADFQIDSKYYSSNGSQYNFTSQLSEPYVVFGADGISFSIFPFTYNPQLNRIVVLKQATFTITYSTSQQRSIKSEYTSNVKESYLSNVFENYEATQVRSDLGGRYLIITAPGYENTITYFANYKRNIGYEVNAVTTNTTGTGSSSIKSYIQAQYDNTATRPDFVLLVGDHDAIPASGGSISYDINDPITDLHYSLLAGDDYFADVFLGRFSVSSSPELQNIINKTIYMELNMHRFSKKAKFLAGEGDNNWMENQLENGHDYAIDYTFNP